MIAATFVNDWYDAEIYLAPVRFGLWDTVAVGEVKKRNFRAAFQLSAKRDSAEPLHTIRRIIVTGSLTGTRLLNRMRSAFH